eukprot:m.252578 g.252578  ORF g.252578 m.252578 type:complete len:67 (+) comp40353_c0_seq46:1332-1532(+)
MGKYPNTIAMSLLLPLQEVRTFRVCAYQVRVRLWLVTEVFPPLLLLLINWDTRMERFPLTEMTSLT